MERQPIALAYCIENIQLAEQIDQDLSSVGWKPKHYFGSKSSPSRTLFEQLSGHSGPIVLLVTDNFLRSVQCMAAGLEFIQENREAILTVIANGTRQDESHRPQPVPTNFERISDMIPYMNYWQDQYLDLRRQRRELKNELDDKAFNDLNNHLRTVREISGEISEFLHLLPKTNDISLAELQECHYEPIFRMVNDLKSWEQLQARSTATQQEAMPVVMTSRSVTTASEHSTDPLLADEAGESSMTKTGHKAMVNGNGSHRDIAPPAIAPAEILSEPATSKSDQEKKDMNTLQSDEVLRQVNEWISSGDNEQAIRHLRTTLSEHPEELRLRYQLARLLAQTQERYSEARQELTQLLQYDPRHTAAHFLIGELAEIEENFSEAAKKYQAVIDIDDQYPDVHYRLGLLLAHKFEDTQEAAMSEFIQAIEQDPKNADAHYQYGILLNEYKQDHKAAIRQFERTLELMPDHPFAYYDLALIYHRQGNMDQARHAYLQASVINPEVRTQENDQAFGLHLTPDGAEAIVQEEENIDKTEETPETEVEEDEVEEVIEVSYDPPLETAPLAAAEIEEDGSSQAVATEDHDSETEDIHIVMEETAALSAATRAAAVDTSVEHDALTALKENIQRLEQMIQAREAEKQKLKEQRPGHGQTVLITGATAGIGRATAEVFASHGYRVIITGRRQERLQEMEQQLQQQCETDIHTLSFDVRDVAAVKKALDGLPKQWREIDILVNNAGKAKGLAPIHEGELEHWEEMIDTNIKGLLYLTRAIAPAMVERGSGHIINICSSAGKEVYPKGNVYCATKYAVDALTQAMRVDLYKHNIRVSQISPAHVEETEFAKVRFDGDAERAEAVYEDFQPLRAADVAEAIYFIASRPAHVNVQDILMMGTQQASNIFIDRSGR